jgi:hypothetical protein
MQARDGFGRALVAIALIAGIARADVGYPGDRPPPPPPGLGPDTVPEPDQAPPAPAPPAPAPPPPPARAGNGDTIYDDRGRPVERPNHAPHHHEDYDEDEGLDHLPPIGAEFAVWFTRLSGRFEHDKVVAGVSVGQATHPQSDDFGLSRYEPAFDIRVKGRAGPLWSFEVEYFIARYSGLGTMQEDLDYDGHHFATGTPVKLRQQDEFLTVQAQYDFVSREHFRMGLPFGVGWFSQLNYLEDRSTGDYTRDRIDLVTPFLGLAVDVPIGRGFGLDGRMRFFAFGWGDEHENYFYGVFDFEFRVYATLGDHVRCYAGYHFTGVSNEETRHHHQDIQGDWDINAFTLGLGVFF